MANDSIYVQRRRDKSGNSKICSPIVRRTPSQSELKTLLRYEPETGLFYHLQSRGKGKAGSVAGSPSRVHGYVELRICNRLFPAHRLAWLYMTGELPERPITIDHINGDRKDNRWSNLRLATYHQQSWNTGAQHHNKSGLKGAWPCKATGKWQSMLEMDRKRIWLGRFDTAEEAHKAYLKAAEERRGAEWTRQNS